MKSETFLFLFFYLFGLSLRSFVRSKRCAGELTFRPRVDFRVHSRQCLGLRVTGLSLRVKAERRLVLFCSCAVQREVFSVQFRERERSEAVGQFYNLVLGFSFPFAFEYRFQIM